MLLYYLKHVFRFFRSWRSLRICLHMHSLYIVYIFIPSHVTMFSCPNFKECHDAYPCLCLVSFSMLLRFGNNEVICICFKLILFEIQACQCLLGFFENQPNLAQLSSKRVRVGCPNEIHMCTLIFNEACVV